MYCLAILDSGNYVFSLCSSLERKGFVFEVISTPCHIARDGCGYCLRFPCEFKDVVMAEAAANGYRIREIFRMIPGLTRNTYEKIH